MILFDFLTGNLDRLVTHLYSLNTTDKYAMLHPVHNLAQTKQGECLVLLIDYKAFYLLLISSDQEKILTVTDNSMTRS